MNETSTDVLVVGAGAAGMYAALAASRAGARVLLADKSKVGVGGATVMAQMTVAAALGHAEPDDPGVHFDDTVASGRELTDEPLARLLCEEAPRRIYETRDMRVNWAADGDRLRQVVAPGHSRRRCCYVDVLATGTAISKGLKGALRRSDAAVAHNLLVTDLVRNGAGEVVGAAALDVALGQPLVIWASAVVLAGGGLTEMYQRNSASVNMTGDAYALGLGAGAELVDFEMVQFFPIAHLAPRVIGLDPIMWDPFRYKLGGRLVNGEGEEFLERYAGTPDNGNYTATRDVVSYAILKEVEAGRGSPSGGVWLDFRGMPAATIHAAFPPVVDKLLSQGIDLTQRAVEVAPTAHYTIGGLRADPAMRTSVDRLFAAGEAVGGAHGANRLSGNAVSEAFVYGARAGESAAERSRDAAGRDATAVQQMAAAVARITGVPGRGHPSAVRLPTLRRDLQQVMTAGVGPVRQARGLERAADELAALTGRWQEAHVPDARTWNLEWAEWFEMRSMLRCAEAVRLAALRRPESRGAHQREDFPSGAAELVRNGVLSAGEDGALVHRWEPVRKAVGPNTGRAAVPAGSERQAVS